MQHEFLWGAATSGHQIEGNNIHSDWWHWEQEGHIESGEISGPATDHWNRYKEDLDLAQSLGLNSYRFSVEWSRLEPKPGEWDLSALAWYENLVGECEKRGLLPMLTLHHFTHPQWFAKKGGFTWSHSVDHFLAYAAKVIHALGSRVPLWCTFNEPMNLVVGQYLAGYMPPAKISPPHASLALGNMLRSHAKTYDLIHSSISRRQGPWRHHPIQVGIAHNMIDFLPARDWHPMERLLTQILRRFYNQSWLDAITGKTQHFGINGMVPYAREVSEAIGRRTADYMGINYYTKAYLRWRSKGKENYGPENMPLGIHFVQPGEPETQMGWALYPQGLGRMIRFVKSYGLPIYITENGIADPKDEQRPGFMTSHLKEVAKEIEAGADVRGFYQWSLLDNFEWIKGFGPRFGLIEVDYKTFERRLRPSALLYRDIIAHHKEGTRMPSVKIISAVEKSQHPSKAIVSANKRASNSQS